MKRCRFYPDRLRTAVGETLNWFGYMYAVGTDWAALPLAAPRSLINCPKQSRRQRRSFWLSENACAFVKTGSSLLTANLDACIVRIFGLKTGGSISFPDPLLEKLSPNTRELLQYAHYTFTKVSERLLSL